MVAPCQLGAGGGGGSMAVTAFAVWACDIASRLRSLAGARCEEEDSTRAASCVGEMFGAAALAMRAVRPAAATGAMRAVGGIGATRGRP